ncbi:hypothetical protein BDA96_09G052000 [Sorghum bicolor]|uniref:Uncharacterized protein n=1 Tax=Sorghum bicolor TaxID=4558 RepID=A0A921QAN3_SORBI|nr:hypothetical protein BDA96_09G052000 [Sorghum bicolor]
MDATALARRTRAVDELRCLSTVADMEAAALARRTRAVEELRRLSTVADMEAAALARRTRAVEELRCLSTVAESDGTTAKSLSTPAAAEQECDHFSLRGYVAMLQKKDPKLCSPHIFHNQPQYEHHDSSPVLVSKSYHRWDCPKCLDRVKVSGHRPTSI